MCAMNLADPAAQTLAFTIAANPVEESSSIYLSGLYEIIGFFWEACEATTAVFGFEVTQDAPGVVLDVDATWVVAWDKDGDALQVTEVFTTAGYVALPPEQALIGPIRFRIAPFAADGSTGVNQDQQVITPVFRRM